MVHMNEPPPTHGAGTADESPQGESREPLISVRGVSKSYRSPAGPVTAVNGVTLSFAAGEITAVLGPNGAGKTTLLDMVLGLNEPDAGHISIAGDSPVAAVRKGRISALLQTGGLLPDLSVKETVQMIAALHHRHCGVDNAMEAAGLQQIARRKVGKCSGGQQQRLKFALALLPDPQIMILDEPTAGMDPAARREFWTRMNEQAKQGTTVLFATHYLEEAEQFARRTVLMHRGEVFLDGPTDQVRKRAGGAQVSVTWEPSTEEIQQLPAVTGHERRGTHITFRTDDADTLARHLLTSTQAHSLSVRQASLEEAFISLTGTDATETDQ